MLRNRGEKEGVSGAKKLAKSILTYGDHGSMFRATWFILSVEADSWRHGNWGAASLLG
jgi:hypothetical protein